MAPSASLTSTTLAVAAVSALVAFTLGSAFHGVGSITGAVDAALANPGVPLAVLGGALAVYGLDARAGRER
ncbi:hypothetical protein ACFO0N_11520 [Halobium salinum]|uniref:Uncharacterized protein n=1 Tax=Halobium salinum TaxID=1364940 RepID=A0ABD5PD61_9EURY|nr:hypothetical protein [Halobium salinum]